MKFLAQLAPNGYICQDWKARSRRSGYVDGIFFLRDGGGRYTSGILTDEDIMKVRARADKAIVLSIATELSVEVQNTLEPHIRKRLAIE